MEGNYNIPKMLILQEIAYEKSTMGSSSKKVSDLAKMVQSTESRKTSKDKTHDFTLEPNDSLAEITAIEPAGKTSFEAKLVKDSGK